MEEEYERRIAKLEEQMKPLVSIGMLKNPNRTNSNVLDEITKHVINNGMGEKIRELRADFFSKNDFKTAENRLAS